MLVISEPSFKVSNWYKEILLGLKSQARKRRENIIECTSVEDLKKTSGKCACILGSNFSWLNDTAGKVLKTNNYPIVLGNNGQLSFDGKCSSVSADIPLSVRNVLKLFEANNKKSVALYGISNDSLSDGCKAKTFCDCFPKSNVFYNNGSFSDCFVDFYEVHSKQPFDAVLCANDYIAVSLIKHLNYQNEDISNLEIVSYSDTAISRLLTPSLTTVVTNHSAFGKAAFAIQDCLEKNPEFTEIHVGVECKIIQRQTTNFNNTVINDNKIAEFKQIENRFYHDDELIEIMGLDKLLETCDKTDFEILSLINQGKHTADITDKCFLSESALKYRINKMKQICGKVSKAEVIKSLNDYRIIDNIVSKQD